MAAVIKIMYLMWAVLFREAGSIMAPLITLRITDRATIITGVGITLAMVHLVRVTMIMLRPLVVRMPDSLMGNSTLLNFSRAVQT